MLKNGNFSDDQIRSQVYTFLFAGHETSATTLTWALYFLGEFPDWRRKIAEEFETIGKVVSPKTLKNVPVTEAFIKETLRIAHVIDSFIIRQVLVDVMLPGGIQMPKGSQFIVDIGCMMENENVFKNPHIFNPQRFIDKTDYDPYWFLPFAGGRRNCIGQVFAMMELKIVLLRFCSNLKVENKIREVNKYNRPPHKFKALTFKIKPDSLEQRFTPI